MGRGRAKAKQTKVARELKYNTPTPDLDALERELSSDIPDEQRRSWYDDPYADPYDVDEDGDSADVASHERGEQQR